jgi:hypothetical protein
MGGSGALAGATAGDRADQRDAPLVSYRRRHTLWGCPATGGVRRAGRRGAFQRQDPSNRADYQGRPTRTALSVGGSGPHGRANPPYGQREFARLECRIGEKKAIVALARTLLGVIWHVLHGRTADQRADAEQVAFKRMVWSWQLSDAQRGGVTARQFLRAHLMRLGLGHDLTHSTRGGTRRALASVEEVLALQPELRGSPAAPPTSG